MGSRVRRPSSPWSVGTSDEKGRLVVDTEQMRGEDLRAFLGQDGGRDAAMAARGAWSSFRMRSRDTLRSNRGQSQGRPRRRCRSPDLRSSSPATSWRRWTPPERRAVVEDLIAQVEEQIEANEETRAFSLSEKLNAALES